MQRSWIKLNHERVVRADELLHHSTAHFNAIKKDESTHKIKWCSDSATERQH